MFQRKGFTLLELIIVIIVIGILASIALPKYMKVAEKARVAEAKNMLSSIRSSQIRYYAQWQNYSGALTNLDVETQVKYFNYSGTAGTAVGVATRQPLEGAGYGAYEIRIDENGTLAISPTTYGFLL